jgi:predicted aspartyl protease
MNTADLAQTYSESGVDLTLLRSNLQRTLDDRLTRNSRALRNLQAFERECRGKNQPSKGAIVTLEIEQLIGTLVTHQVKFILIGGLAMRAHGSAHITEDADFCYERSVGNCQALADAMAPFHPYMRGAPKGLPFKFDADAIRAGLNFTLVTDLGDVDFLGELRGIGFYDRVLAMSVEKTVFGYGIQVLSVDGLITAKKSAGRAKDQGQLLELEEIRKLKQARQLAKAPASRMNMINQKEQTVGRFSVEIELANFFDIANAETGALPPDQVRKGKIMGVVDSGASRLVLPAAMVKQLGLKAKRKVRVRYADGRQALRDEVDGVQVRMEGREGVFKAVVEPKRETALIGAIVLEDLDFLVDCDRQRVVPRDPRYVVSELE